MLFSLAKLAVLIIPSEPLVPNPPGGNPEAIGITSRELYDMIVSLKNKQIKAADIVELNPTFDNGATASLAARMISIIISMNLK